MEIIRGVIERRTRVMVRCVWLRLLKKEIFKLTLKLNM